MKRTLISIDGRSRLLVFALVGLAIAASAGCSSPQPATKGRLLITLEDPKTSPEAFVGLAQGEAAHSDIGGLTIFDLPLPDPSDRNAVANYQQITAPNSARVAPGAMALSPDGRFVLIAGGGSGDVTLVDLTGPSARIAGGVALGSTPVDVAFHPEGRLAAVLCEPDAQLHLLEIAADGLRPLESWPLRWSLGDDASPSSIAWHPGGYFIGLTLPAQNAAAFLEFQSRHGSYSVRQWGQTAPTGRRPARGVWSPDGRFFITADRRWSDAEPGMRVYEGGGSLTVIRVADTIDLGGEVGHDRAARLTLASAPDALAVSPDGRRLVVASRRAGDLGRPRGEREGGLLTLIEFNRAAGGVSILDEHRAASLSSGVAFDPSGRTLFVTDLGNSEAQTWRVDRDRLVYTGVNISTGRSPHGVAVAR